MEKVLDLYVEADFIPEYQKCAGGLPVWMLAKGQDCGADWMDMIWLGCILSQYSNFTCLRECDLS